MYARGNVRGFAGALSGAMLVAGCGRVGFDAGARDGRSGDDAGGDAVVDTVGTGSFGTPSSIVPLESTSFDDDPTLTADLLEIYFASNRPGGLDSTGDIWFATRPTATSAFGPPQLVAGINSNVEDQSPGISADGLTLYFSSRRTAVLTGSNFWITTRTDRASPWSSPVLATDLSTNMDEFEAQPDASGLRLVLYRDLGGGDRSIFEATRATAADAWGTPVLVPSLDTAGSEHSPCLTNDGLAIYFGTDRGGTAGVHDLYIATRPSVTAPFATPEPVPGINDAADDDDPWVSPDGHWLVFSSQRTGDSAIYGAAR